MNTVTRRSFLKLGAASVVPPGTLPGTLLRARPNWPNRPLPTPFHPNVILIVLDDAGFADFSCYRSICQQFGGSGSPIETPNIDRIAQQGMLFTNAHSSAAVCTASRVGILTGIQSQRFRISELDDAITPASQTGLVGGAARTLGNLFRSFNYVTGFVGKSHIGNRPEHLPPSHGFDRFHGVPLSIDEMPPALPFYDGYTVTDTYPTPSSTGTMTKRLVDETQKFLAHVPSGLPYMLYVGLTAPHTPWFPQPPFAGASGQGPRWDTILEIDWAVGQILANANGNTLVAITSDNGPEPDLSSPDRNAIDPYSGLRGGKWGNYEFGTRMPLLISWPGRIPAGATSHELVSLLDIFPTMEHILEPNASSRRGRTTGSASIGRATDGISILPLLTATETATAAAIQTTQRLNRPSPLLEFYLEQPECAIKRYADPRDGKEHFFKLWWSRNRVRLVPELYNLDLDPGESTDLAAACPQLAAQMLADAKKEITTYSNALDTSLVP